MRATMLALLLPVSAIARSGMDPASIASIIGALPDDQADRDQDQPEIRLATQATAQAGGPSVASIIGALPDDDQPEQQVLATQARTAHADANPDKHAELSAGAASSVVGERDLTPAEAHHQLELKAHREDTPKAKPKVAAAAVASAVETAAEQKLVADATAYAQAQGKATILSQCQAFAGYLKKQNTKGVSLVRTMRGMCDPIVANGAPPNYAAMCSNLGSAVERFAADPSWSPTAVCEEVSRVFKEAGIGA